MKLVEILARELGEWPEGVDEIFQDYDRELRYIGWNASTLTGKRPDDLADDHRRLGEDHPAGVTREMWEAERAKLGGKTEWNGEGLPPVGCPFELRMTNDVWIAAMPTAYGKKHMLFEDESGEERIEYISKIQARPIRTPEQIAAEKREKAIIEMKEVFLRGASVFWKGARLGIEALYDAGYRKQEES